MKPLSPKQRQIYDYIIEFSTRYGYPPSVREIADHLGLKSPSTVHFHLKGLRAAGYIHQAEGKTRAITICGVTGKPEAIPIEERHDRVPIVGNVAAGTPILAEECIEDYLTFDTNGLTGEHFALRVRGESMKYAGILPGDLVIVHQQENAYNGQIVVAMLNDEATVKTLRRKNGHTWLMPENPDYDPIDGDGCVILGRVIAVVRYY